MHVEYTYTGIYIYIYMCIRIYVVGIIRIPTSVITSFSSPILSFNSASFSNRASFSSARLGDYCSTDAECQSSDIFSLCLEGQCTCRLDTDDLQGTCTGYNDNDILYS